MKPELYGIGNSPMQAPRDGWSLHSASIDRQARVLRERFSLTPEQARTIADIAFSTAEVRP
ncbi:hypothetical protein BSZ19_04030 [Bradyrhizobium japonicum]|uniref:Uncharacterized protein n=1 Tax=Bradyrhizobium japonicum TaxID=375 RepID=A0A1Y2JZD8_BRAJP|nr:hypothetical protein [Bradyrhizobium japonicum]OSJ36477.1 hypothetical protein BSZ19_04030 [Bradyrhizobium japonicum]